ncbi:MAG: hypothetical protein ABI637_07430, partial [Gemmatimonadota bacterium]
RLRVLFPIDPMDDNFVRGGHRYEIKGRGGREAFMVDVSSGQGAVYAAVSRDPLRFDAFVQNDHWDVGALNPSQLRSDPEPELTDLVQRMATSRFEYDILRYDVSYGESISYYTPAVVRRAYHPDPFCDRYIFTYDCDPYYYGGRSGLGVSVVLGRPYRNVYDPFYYGYGYGYGYDPYYYGGGGYYRPYQSGYYYPHSNYYYPQPAYTGRLYSPYQFKAVNRTWSGTPAVQPYRDRAGSVQASPAFGIPVRPEVTRANAITPSRDGYDAGSSQRRRVNEAQPGAQPSAPVARPEIAPSQRPEGRRSEVRDEQRARQDSRIEQARQREERARPTMESAPREQTKGEPRLQPREAPREQPRMQPREEPREQPRMQPREEPRAQPRAEAPRSEPRSAPAPRQGGTYSRPAEGGGRRR